MLALKVKKRGYKNPLCAKSVKEPAGTIAVDGGRLPLNFTEKGTEGLKITHLWFGAPRIIASQWRMTVAGNRWKSAMASS